MDVSLAIVTAIPIEAAAVRLLLDGATPFPVDGDRNNYHVGTMDSGDAQRPHRIAMTVLPQDGTRVAAAVCADAVRSFPSTRCVLAVGIAGGVPAPDRPEHHVRLGDVVIATGLADYGHVTALEGDVWPRRPLGTPWIELLRADRELEADQAAGRRPWEHWLGAGEWPVPGPFGRPAVDTDVVLGADGPVPHPDDAIFGRRAGFPRIHHGVIGSGDCLVRDAGFRDRIARRHGLYAVEMEGAGIAMAATLVNAGWFVVRGVADYCDQAKDGVWQPYAALAAAAYTRALLARCPPAATRSRGVVEPALGGGDPGGFETLDGFGDVVDALLGVDQIRDDVERRALLALLPTHIRAAIPDSARGRTHVIAIVRTCARYRHGRDALLTALRMLVPAGSVELERVESMMAAHWPRES